MNLDALNALIQEATDQDRELRLSRSAWESRVRANVRLLALLDAWSAVTGETHPSFRDEA